ncbi:unnamed protein product [Microthlaspi erraticum]|uniref:Uncharacterized protein n=1 Tax=Microthlaspi erraticum TaxID=1685480 RepID=A0A6D2K2E0_9BRAS|nr:unnamed protein product [Microthlaspi erraticum]
MYWSMTSERGTNKLIMKQTKQASLLLSLLLILLLCLSFQVCVTEAGSRRLGEERTNVNPSLACRGSPRASQVASQLSEYCKTIRRGRPPPRAN